jgi:hypothetical protein
MQVDITKFREEFNKIKDILGTKYKLVELNEPNFPYKNIKVKLECNNGHIYTSSIGQYNFRCNKCINIHNKHTSECRAVNQKISNYEKNLETMIYQNKISNIENIIVSSMCLLTLPCQHGCKIIYKNGTTKGITLLTPHIADIVKTINKEVNNTCVQSWVSNAKIISEIYNIDYEEDFKNAKIKKE